VKQIIQSSKNTENFTLGIDQDIFGTSKHWISLLISCDLVFEFEDTVVLAIYQQQKMLYLYTRKSTVSNFHHFRVERVCQLEIVQKGTRTGKNPCQYSLVTHIFWNEV